MVCIEPQRPDRQVVKTLLLLEDLMMYRTENPERAAEERGSDGASETNSILSSQLMLKWGPRARNTEEA